MRHLCPALDFRGIKCEQSYVVIPIAIVVVVVIRNERPRGKHDDGLDCDHECVGTTNASSTNDVDFDANDIIIVHDELVVVAIVGDDAIANEIM